MDDIAGEGEVAPLAREDEIRKQLSALFEQMMSALHKQPADGGLDVGFILDPSVQSFVGAHSQTLDSAFARTPMSDAMRASLVRSDYIFSGIKTFHELNEAFPSLMDENGNRKPFEQFLNDVRSIDQTYNQNWLRAEYNFAQASANAASQWERFEEDGDRYNLQYRTAHDARVRPEHAALDRVTLPPSDPFWSEYYPPNGWGCRCTVVQVKKSKYPETPHDEAMQRGQQALAKDTRGMFRFNPGIERKTFPDYNPYTIRRCRDCDIANGKAKLAFVPDNELCAACQLVRQCEDQRFEVKRKFDNGGKVSVHRLVDDKDSDYSKLMEIAEFFAKTYGEDVKLTPKMSRPQRFVYQNIYHSLMGTLYEGTCPDLLVGDKWYEHEGFISLNPKRAFSNMMNHGLKQSDRLIIDRPDLTERYMMRSIVNRINEGQKITEVWLREKDGSLSLLFKKTDG